MMGTDSNNRAVARARRPWIALVPLAVANGRLRARDAGRDVERTLPLSAITKVAGLGVSM